MWEMRNGKRGMFGTFLIRIDEILNLVSKNLDEEIGGPGSGGTEGARETVCDVGENVMGGGCWGVDGELDL